MRRGGPFALLGLLSCTQPAEPVRVVLVPSATEVALSSKAREPTTPWLIARDKYETSMAVPTAGGLDNRPMWSWPLELEFFEVLKTDGDYLLVRPVFEGYDGSGPPPCGARHPDALTLQVWVRQADVLELLPVVAQGDTRGSVEVSEACAAAVSSRTSQTFSALARPHDSGLLDRMYARKTELEPMMQAQFRAHHGGLLAPTPERPRAKLATIRPNAPLTWVDATVAGATPSREIELGHFGFTRHQDRVCFEENLGRINDTRYEVCAENKDIVVQPSGDD